MKQVFIAKLAWRNICANIVIVVGSVTGIKAFYETPSVSYFASTTGDILKVCLWLVPSRFLL